MSYIKSGWSNKYLNSPKVVFSPALLKLQDEIDLLHEQYDRLRCSDGRTWMPAKLSDEVRKIGKKLAMLQKQYNDQFDLENPEYVKHWRG